MNTIKITIGNRFLPNVIEEFITSVDIADLEEVEMAANECCGEFLNTHSDIYNSLLPDIDWEAYAEACFYSIEEVNINEL